jgi:PAS domain S-box-containing protein
MGPSPAAAQQRKFVVAAVATGVSCALFAVVLTSSLPASTRATVSGVGLLLGGVFAALSSWGAARRSQGARRRGWILLTAAAVVAVLGNVWVVAVGADPVESPSVVGESSIALALVLSIAGLLNFPTVRQRGAERALMVLDGLVMGGAVLVIASIVVYDQVLESGTGTLAARAVTLLFVLLDVGLATLALLLIVRSRSDRWVLSLLGAAFLLYAVADLAFAVRAAQDSFAFGSLHDLGWIAGYLLIGTAAWHPQAPGRDRQAATVGLSDVQGTMMVFGVLLGALAVQVLYGRGSDLSTTQTVLWLILVLAAGARQTLLTADNASLRHGLERRVAEQTADLRRMAKQTDLLLSSVGDGIYGVDTDGRITFVNPSGAEALGCAPQDLLGRRAHQEFHAPQADGTPYSWTGCYVTEAIRHGVVSAAEEDTYVRRDGETFPVEITASPLLDDDRITGAVVVFRDVTQRREVDRMKNEFLSVVSHELRTPLTSIRGSLGLLATGSLVELTPQANRMVSIAVESSERLTRLINDILDIERIQSGSLPMNLVPQEARDLLEASASELGGLARSLDVRVEIGAAEGRVLADTDRIVQTLTNLLGNALKFSPPGGVVRLEATPGDGTVVFAVHDDGRGIPADKLDSVFERFEQVDSSDARQKGGTGLGLAISRGIVERHGGRIWAESTEHVGTTVRFSLPRVGEERRVEDVDAAPAAPLVLVCDDDPGVVASFALMLSRHGYRPLGVTGGRQAVERALSDRPAAVLLDLAMPGTSGAEVVAELKAHPRTRNIPVVVVSGMGPTADPDLASAAEDWLVKPVSEERLVGTVTAAVEGRRRDTSVLVVEDDEDLAGVLAALLASHGLDIVRVSTVAAAIAQLERKLPQVVVLDLALPDGDGAEVVARLRSAGWLDDTAVVVYSAADVLEEQREALEGDHTVFLTKARVAPEELEDRVLRLMDAVTGRQAVSGTHAGMHTGIPNEESHGRTASVRT